MAIPFSRRNGIGGADASAAILLQVPLYLFSLLFVGGEKEDADVGGGGERGREKLR